MNYESMSDEELTAMKAKALGDLKEDISAAFQKAYNAGASEEEIGMLFMGFGCGALSKIHSDEMILELTEQGLNALHEG